MDPAVRDDVSLSDHVLARGTRLRVVGGDKFTFKTVVRHRWNVWVAKTGNANLCRRLVRQDGRR